MTERHLPITATDNEIKALVVEWSELLAEKRFGDALAIFPHSSDEMAWTPELLEKIIAGYGVHEDDDPETLRSMLERRGIARFEITTLRGRPDADEVVRDRIDVDRENLFGLDPRYYLGMVHYGDVPLSGSRSDLTARFYIKRVGSDSLTLDFLDIHVM